MCKFKSWLLPILLHTTVWSTSCGSLCSQGFAISVTHMWRDPPRDHPLPSPSDLQLSLSLPSAFPFDLCKAKLSYHPGDTKHALRMFLGEFNHGDIKVKVFWQTIWLPVLPEILWLNYYSTYEAIHLWLLWYKQNKKL